MADTSGKPRSRATSDKSRTVKSRGRPRKTAPVGTPTPETVTDLTAADIIDAVEQTLADSVEPTKKGVALPNAATKEAAIDADEPVIPAPVVDPVIAPAPVEAVAAPMADVEDDSDDRITTEQKIEQKGTPLMADVMETTRKYTEEAKDRFQSAFSEISEKAKSGVEKSTKAFEELGEIAKGNVEALVESGRIASKGIESLGQDAAEFGRLNFEKASAAMKKLATVKTPAEFFQMQSELMTGVFDSFAKETAKQSEALLKLAGEVAQPISTRVSVVTEKARSLAA